MKIEYKLIDKKNFENSNRFFLRQGVPLRKFLQLKNIFTELFIPNQIDHIVIQRASVIEVKKFKTWILGGELALTTLENFCTVEQQLSLIEQLDKGGASCLAFHPGNSRNENIKIFEETLSYARERRLPMVLLHSHITYSDVIEKVFNIEFMSKEQDIESSSVVNQVLFQFLSHHITLEDMINRISNIIGREIILFDVDMTTIASSHKIKNAFVLKTLNSRAFKKFINQQTLIKLFMNDNTLHIKVDNCGELLNVILAPINYDYGLKFILCIVGEPSQMLLSKTTNDIVNALKLEKEKSNEVNFELMEYANNTLLFKRDKIEAEKAFLNLGSNFDEQSAVLLISIENVQFKASKKYRIEFNNNLKSRILKYVKTELSEESAAFWTGDQLVIYLSQVMPEERVMIMNEINNKIKYYFPTISLILGLSSKDTNDVLNAYAEATQAIEEGKREGKRENHFDDLGFTKIFTNTNNDYYIKKFYEYKLSPILSLESARQHDLLSTLESFINNKMSYKETADDLFLHPNTVRYRIQQLKKIFQDEGMFEKSDMIFELQLALRLLSRNSKV